MPLARTMFGRLLYACSAAPFIAFVAFAFWSERNRDVPLKFIVANLLTFAAAGVTAILVKNMAFNAAMAANAYPYAAFLLEKWGTDPSGWPANDIEGSVVYVSIYCIVGWGSTAVWVLVYAPSIGRWMR